MDQGGTFTDIVRLGPAGVTLQKVLTDRADLAALGKNARTVRRGTTAATNALLERSGAPTLLITNRGLSDLAILGDQQRPDLFALHIRRPPPLHCATLEIDGRIAADGAVLTPATIDVTILRAHRAAGIVAAAVVLVHGPLAPEEECRIGRACKKAGLQVTLGHAVAPSRGFLDRLRTALADAALSPLLPRAPGLYMRSDGGLATEDGAGGGTWRGRDAALSGPAGGVIACAALAQHAQVGPAFGLDMGGTSADVCRVDGEPERVAHVTVGGWRLRVPAIRLETVAAGGGSLLSVQGGVYAVGPRSAGSNPGPAAYGRGGPATVTDCEAVLGRLPTFPAICGPDHSQPLDLAAARAALQAIDPTRPVEAIAEGFRVVAAEVMAGAIGQLAARLGVEPQAHALVAFGGAGPGHACAVAARLSIQTVLIPRLAGAFSAVGIGMAGRRAEQVAPIRDNNIDAALAAARSRLPWTGTERARLAMRHTGTAELIEIPLPCDDPEEAFAAAHRAQFGFTRPTAPIEAVEVRVAVESPPEHTLSSLPDPAPLPPLPTRTTRAWFGGWREVPLRRIHEADGLVGPALLAGSGTTIVVEAGWSVSVHAGYIALHQQRAAPPRMGVAFDPVHTAVFGTRVMAIAEQMGERLARLARSVSIRQRHDFSCAIFDAAGRLVANAPHVPVHLGAMGETVRDLIARRGEALAAG
ncbi:MAG: 5-oxoprolinase (ATP-hydrolyzing), partial [Myxococcota bacterium]